MAASINRRVLVVAGVVPDIFLKNINSIMETSSISFPQPVQHPSPHLKQQPHQQPTIRQHITNWRAKNFHVLFALTHVPSRIAV